MSPCSSLRVHETLTHPTTPLSPPRHEAGDALTKLEGIGVNAFERCSSLTAIAIPDGVTTIEYGAFCYCSSLTAITIPDSVTTIGNQAFEGCSVLTKLILSPAVSVGIDCFSNCTALISAAADKNMSTVEDLLRYRWNRKPAVLERVNALLCQREPGITWRINPGNRLESGSEWTELKPQR